MSESSNKTLKKAEKSLFWFAVHFYETFQFSLSYATKFDIKGLTDATGGYKPPHINSYALMIFTKFSKSE